MVGARLGDAITNMALSQRVVLQRYGGSEIFARHVDPSVHGHVQPIDNLAAHVSPGDVIVFHVSIGDDVVWDAVFASGARVCVSYHNITPAGLFDDDPVFAAMLAQGREQLVAAAPHIERIVTESEFNRRDLVGLGFGDVDVAPGIVDPFRLTHVHSDPHFGRAVRARVPAEMLLFVGQILPHKRPQLLLSALHLLLAHHRPSATLVLAGHQPVPRFADHVARFATSLGLGDRVWMIGGVDDPQLGELYRRADVVVTASEHEGLCIPVLEAMAMSVPVVSSAHGALPETLGGCGLVVEPDSAAGYAESIHAALEPATRTPLVLAGRRRARMLSLDHALAAAAAYYDSWV